MNLKSDDTQQSYLSRKHLTVITPSTGWRMLNLRELWAYHELFYVLTKRDIKVRYKQTVLGVAWAILQPVVTMVVFAIIFGSLAKMPSDGYPYPIYTYAALLPWMFFANSVTSSANSLVNNTNLISKIYFPRLIVPMSTIGAGLIDLAISTIVLLFLMVYFDIAWTLNLLAVPVLLVVVIFTALGVGVMISALTVAYRDFRYIVPFGVQIWMYASPVVYPASLVPEKWQWLVYINPMAGIIEAFRSAFFGRAFDLNAIALSFIVSIVMLLLGAAYFGKVERRFADII